MKFTDAQDKAVKMLSSKEFIERVKEEDETMLEHLDTLKNINKNGYITVNSQAGRKEKGKSFQTGKPYEMIERAYTIGFMQESKASIFIKNMSFTDKNAAFVPYCDDKMHLPSSLDIPLTITKTEGHTRIETHTSLTLPESVWQHYRKQAGISKGEKIVFITCWDTKWNRNASTKNGLFSEILKALS
jgi:hypothetical protein